MQFYEIFVQVLILALHVLFVSILFKLPIWLDFHKEFVLFFLLQVLHRLLHLSWILINLFILCIVLTNLSEIISDLLFKNSPCYLRSLLSGSHYKNQQISMFSLMMNREYNQLLLFLQLP